MHPRPARRTRTTPPAPRPPPLLRSSFHCFCIRSASLFLLRRGHESPLHSFLHELHRVKFCALFKKAPRPRSDELELSTRIAVREAVMLGDLVFSMPLSFAFPLAVVLLFLLHPSFLRGQGSTGNKRAAVPPSQGPWECSHSRRHRRMKRPYLYASTRSSRRLVPSTKVGPLHVSGLGLDSALPQIFFGFLFFTCPNYQN